MALKNQRCPFTHPMNSYILLNHRKNLDGFENSVYKAYSRVQKIIEETGSLPVPLHIRNAPTKLMKNLGYGQGYKYAHQYPEAIVDQECLPEEIIGNDFFSPSDRGFEKIIKERMDYIKNKKKL
jgi:putative ATPase